MSGRIGETFLEQITANIDDDATRLVFSDWLEEQGESARAAHRRSPCLFRPNPRRTPLPSSSCRVAR